MATTRRTFTAWALAAPAMGARAQDKYPGRPIRFIVPFPPGASTDNLARALGQKLSVNMGVPVVVENRPGGGGIMGTELLARSAPDGYTIGMAVPATHTLPVVLSRKVPYDPIADFTPLSIVATNLLAVVVSPALPVRTLRQLVEYARANPGKLSYGSSGTGSSQHLLGEMLNQFARVNLVHVPYKGGSVALNDLLGGQIEVGYVVVSTVLPHVKAGRLRMLAAIDDRRYSGLPDVPTHLEALPGFEPKTSWLGIFGPAKMPPAISAQLVAQLQMAARDPELARFLNASGMPVIGSNGEQLAARLREDIAGWAPIVRAAKISVLD